MFVTVTLADLLWILSSLYLVDFVTLNHYCIYLALLHCSYHTLYLNTYYGLCLRWCRIFVKFVVLLLHIYFVHLWCLLSIHSSHLTTLDDYSPNSGPTHRTFKPSPLSSRPLTTFLHKHVCFLAGGSYVARVTSGQQSKDGNRTGNPTRNTALTFLLLYNVIELLLNNHD